MDNIKKFEDFLDRMQGLLDNAKKQGHIIVRIEDLENAFPELKESKESEDERIRKEILDYLSTVDDKELIPCESWVAWLEKQGEHINFLSKIQVGDKVTRNKDGVLVNLSQLNRVAKPAEKQCKKLAEKYNITGIKSKHAEGKLGEMIKEMKSTHKVELKFHKGDWVILSLVGEKDKLVQVQTVEYFPSGQPRYVTTNGKWFGDGANARLWTIQDAKDGDILYSIRVNAIILYKYRSSDGIHINAYCALQKGIFIKQEMLWDRDFVPATKEQCDFLFQKMKEAGYEWDAEKKELKKIIIPIFNIGDVVRLKNGDGLEWLVEERHEDGNYTIVCADRDDCVLLDDKWEIVKRKPAEWHREDEQNLNACLGYIPDEFLRKWLTDIIHVKYDNPAWSEEDEKNRYPLKDGEIKVGDIITYFKNGKKGIMLVSSFDSGTYPRCKWGISHICGTAYGNWAPGFGPYYAATEKEKQQLYDTMPKEVKDWLKSLKERYTWKPSDEQMKQLGWIAEQNKDNIIGKELMTLYNDLKQLKQL